MNILSESSEEIEIEASWTGELKGFNGFPDGKKVGSGNSVQGKMVLQYRIGKVFLLQVMDRSYYLKVVT